jgi:hypothetical protein
LGESIHTKPKTDKSSNRDEEKKKKKEKKSKESAKERKINNSLLSIDNEKEIKDNNE